jgi:LysR family transcriptional regulator, transcription activator of glutamate synthase operon
VADEPYIPLRPSTLLHRLLKDQCEEAGLVPAIAFESDDLPTVHGFGAAGLGVAVLPWGGASLSRPLLGSVELVDIATSRASRDIGLTWSGSRRLLPAAQLFRERWRYASVG